MGSWYDAKVRNIGICVFSRIIARLCLFNGMGGPSLFTEYEGNYDVSIVELFSGYVYVCIKEFMSSLFM